MRIAIIASLLLASATLTANAFADTVTFASTPGVTTFSAPGHEGTGFATAYQNSAYAPPLNGSVWVSTNSSGGYTGAETVLYTDTFTLLANEVYSGSVSFLVDNSAGIMVNGHEIYANNSSTGYSSATSVNLLSSYFHSGTNTITLEDTNVSGPQAVDFFGTLNGVPAVTPEPSSLILLGTGLLGIAGAARRRLRSV